MHMAKQMQALRVAQDAVRDSPTRRRRRHYDALKAQLLRDEDFLPGAYWYRDRDATWCCTAYPDSTGNVYLRFANLTTGEERPVAVMRVGRTSTTRRPPRGSIPMSRLVPLFGCSAKEVERILRSAGVHVQGYGTGRWVFESDLARALSVAAGLSSPGDTFDNRYTHEENSNGTAS